MQKFPADPVIIAGDFNGHIANGNQIYGDQNLLNNVDLLCERLTLDEESNKRGKHLVDAMEDIGFMVINGSSKSDTLSILLLASQVARS